MDVNIQNVDKGKVKSFVLFDLLLTPLLARALFVLGSIVILLGGAAYPFLHARVAHLSMEGYRSGFDVGAFLVGILISAVFTPLFLLALRIFCEAAVSLFRLQEVLPPRKPAEAPPPPKPSEPAKTETPPSPPPPA